MAGAGPRVTESAESRVSPSCPAGPGPGPLLAQSGALGFVCAAVSPARPGPPCGVAGLTAVDVLMGARQPVSIPRVCWFLSSLSCGAGARGCPGFVFLDECVCRSWFFISLDECVCGSRSPMRLVCGAVPQARLRG